MSHERPAPRSSPLPRRTAHKIMMRYQPGDADLLTPPPSLDVEGVHVLLQCRDATTGERVTVFQSDREFTWQELAPTVEDIAMILRRGPVRSYLHEEVTKDL